MQDGIEAHGVPAYLRISGTIARSVFLATLIVVTYHISLPENLSLNTFAHFTLGDFVRSGMGVLVCLGTLVQLFRRPADDQGYRTWAFIGLVFAAVVTFLAALKLMFPDLA